MTRKQWLAYCRALKDQISSERSLVPAATSAIIPRRVVKAPGPSPAPSKGSKTDETPLWITVGGSGNSKLIVLTGRPGEGKTVCLDEFALHLLEQFLTEDSAVRDPSQKQDLPVRVRLSRYDARDNRVADLLIEALASVAKDQLTDAVLHRILDGSQPLVILADGLDEAKSGQDSLLEELHALSRHRACHLIVSCREAWFGMVREHLVTDSVWELAPLTSEEAVRYLQDALGPDSRHQEYLMHLSGDRLADLLSNPFFLSAYASLPLTDVTSHLGRFRLCEALTDHFYTREFSKYPGAVEASVLPLCQSVLEECASEMHSRSVASLGLSQYHDIVDRTFIQRLFSQQTSVVKDTVIAALEHLPVLGMEQAEVIFTHSILQDYFAARWLKSHPEEWNRDIFLDRYAGRAAWEYSLVLLAGSSQDGGHLLELLCGMNVDGRLTAQCLLEAKSLMELGILGPELVEQLLERVTGLLKATTRVSPDDVLDLAPILPFVTRSGRETVAAELAELFIAANLWSHSFWQIGSWSELENHARGLPVLQKYALDRVDLVVSDLSSYGATARIGALQLAAILDEWDRVLLLARDENPLVRLAFEIAVSWCFEHSTMHQDALVEALDLLVDDTDEWIRHQAIELLVEIESNHPGYIVDTRLNSDDRQASLEFAIVAASAGNETAIWRLWEEMIEETPAGDERSETLEQVMSALVALARDGDSYAAYQGLFLAWAMPHISVSADRIQSTGWQDVRELVIDCWEATKVDEDWSDWEQILTVLLAEPDESIAISTGRATWRQSVDWNTLYQLTWALLVANHWSPRKGAKLILSYLLLTYPDIFANLLQREWDVDEPWADWIASLGWPYVESLLSSFATIRSELFYEQGKRQIAELAEIMRTAVADKGRTMAAFGRSGTVEEEE